jgi:hypothetical protein
MNPIYGRRRSNEATSTAMLTPALRHAIAEFASNS